MRSICSGIALRASLCATCCCLYVALQFGAVRAEDAWTLLDRSRPEVHDMLRDHFRRRAHAALDRRLEVYESLKTPEQVLAWQRDMRGRFVEILGGFPRRSPLMARTVSQFERDGYRVENVIYESQPGFPVTANLYLPKTAAPYPAVLFPCGHTPSGKAAGVYQKACILLARNGIAALIYDPVGQGERKQVLKHDESGHPTSEGEFGPTGDHNVTGIAPILLGRGLATYRIHDGRRSIDYLQSRDDIIPNRIGCTGNSGGGLLTSYLMAIDSRIVAAAPGNFVTTTRIKNDRPGPGDAEQNIFAQIRYGLDHPDYAILRAPKPTLILAATQDFVPIEGSWIAFRQIKRVYSRLGFSERVDLAEADAKHGYNSKLRVAMTRWMRRWLLGKDDAVVEPEDVATEPEANLRCTAKGQVLLHGAKSLFDLYKEEEQWLLPKRTSQWDSLSDEARRELVRQTAGIRPVDELDEPQVIRLAPVVTDGGQIERLILVVNDLTLPALLFRPSENSKRFVIYLHGDGKHVAAGADGDLRKLMQDGATVLAIDVSGIGETAMRPWRFGSLSGVLGPNTAEFFVAYMLGESFVGMRAEEILIAARWLQRHLQLDEPVDLKAVGELTVPALHAAVVEPTLFRNVELKSGLVNWSSVIHTALTKRQLANTVHGALRNYDLPDLEALMPETRLQVIDPRDAAGLRVEEQ